MLSIEEVVTTYGAPWWLIRLVLRDPVRAVILGGLARLCGRGVRTRWAVPSTMYWYVSGEHYLGTLVIRHELTPELAEVGGHIGYHVVVPWQRQGHATGTGGDRDARRDGGQAVDLRRVRLDPASRDPEGASLTSERRDVDGERARNLFEEPGAAFCSCARRRKGIRQDHRDRRIARQGRCHPHWRGDGLYL